MGRTKVYASAKAQAAPAGAEMTRAPARAGLVQRAAAGPAPKHVAVRPPTPTVQTEMNHSADFVAAAMAPTGRPIATGRVELVAPGASFAAPPGMRLGGFLNRDGSAVKFAGMAGAVFLDHQEAAQEFGPLVSEARDLLAAHSVTARPPGKPARPPAVHRAAATTAEPAVGASAAVQTALDSSTGHSLPQGERGRLESSFGADLGRVRVHTDSASDLAARSVQAHAFTTGQDVFFRSGQYRPSTADGQKLLAHEVAHTVQQSGTEGSVARQADLSALPVSEPGDRLETEAEVAAERSMRGQQANVRPIQQGALLARLADGPPKAPPTPAPVPTTAKAPTTGPQPAQAATSPPAVPGKPPAAGAEKAAPSPDAKKPAEGAKKPADQSTAPKAAPAQSDGLQAVVAEVASAGQEQKQHDPAEQKAAEARAAVGVSDEAAKGEGKRHQVEALAAQKPAAFDRVDFKRRLRQKIQELQADDAKGIKEEDKAQGVNAAVKGEVAAGKKAAAAGIEQASNETPQVGAKVPGTELPAAQPGDAPKVDGSRAVPAPVPDEKTSLAGESKSIDEQMTAAKVTPEQLGKANEPTFQAAADSRVTAQTKAEALPAQARAGEQQTLAKAQGEAATATQAGLSEMHGQRAELLTGGRDVQTAGTGKHEEVKKRLAVRFDEIYGRTKKDVDERLARIDKEVDSSFESGATLAKVAFYAYLGTRLLIYYATGGWLADAFTNGNSREEIFDEGRKVYQQAMELVIDDVASVVEAGLNEVVGLIAKGKAELDDEVAKLPQEEQAVGREVAQGVQEKFAELEKKVEEKQKQVIDSVAEKYVAAQKEVDSVINVLKDPVGAAIAYAKETIAGVIETLNKMRELLMGILAKAGEAIDLILADPIAFIGNLTAGVKQGLMNFVANIGTHLQKGLFEWLFGALSGAGIQIPDTLDLKGILSIVLQVLGLTWPNIRKRAVAIVGEKIVSALETASEIVIAIVTRGAAGLWEYLKEKAAGLLQGVLDGIKSFLIEKVIVAGVTWIIGLLNPASAFVKACKAIYDVIMWIMTNGQQLLEFVNAVVDSVLSIAKGDVAPAAAAVEKALAKAVPVAIGFLAGLLGLGGLSEKIKEVILEAQALVNEAIDWVINKAVALVKKAGKMLGFGKEKEKGEEKPQRTADDEAKVSLDMSGEGHTLTAHVHAGRIQITMASNEEHELHAVISRAEGEVKSSKHPDKEKALVLEGLARLRKDSDYDEIMQDYNLQDDPTKRSTSQTRYLEMRLGKVAQDLMQLAKATGLKSLTDFAATVPEKRFLPAKFFKTGMIRRKLYSRGSAYNSKATALRQRVYEALVAKDDTALATALTGGQTLQTFTKPKKAEAVKGGEYDVDHVIPLAKHWYDTGWNSGDGERIGATDSDANLQLLTERENSVKGSKYAGKVYHFNERPYVGPNFTSDIADAKTIDGEQFHTEDQR